MAKLMRDWSGVLVLITVVAVATLWMGDSVHDLEVRMSVVETKLDMLIRGLNIEVSTVVVESAPGE